MKWLQWSTIDLKNGSGGVEMHARCVARELKVLYNIETTFSRDPEALFSGGYDVIQTHGSSIPSALQWRARQKNKRALWVETLHGLSFERMRACGEWLWLGGYVASAHEALSILQADVVLAVHENLSLFSLLKKKKKHVGVCGNGWDSFGDASRTPTTGVGGAEPHGWPLALAHQLTDTIKDPFWVFIGRGDDPVKNVDLVKKSWREVNLKLVSVPGSGFEDAGDVVKSGILNSEQIRDVLLSARGLIMTSFYEGLPLVALEALALGTPVVTSAVGGLRSLSKELQGLELLPQLNNESVKKAVTEMMKLKFDPASRMHRGLANRRHLRTWSDVAQATYTLVNQAFNAKKIQASP